MGLVTVTFELQPVVLVHVYQSYSRACPKIGFFSAALCFQVLDYLRLQGKECNLDMNVNVKEMFQVPKPWF